MQYSFVIQRYEVKFQTPLECGGAYVKLVEDPKFNLVYFLFPDPEHFQFFSLLAHVSRKAFMIKPASRLCLVQTNAAVTIKYTFLKTRAQIVEIFTK
jgi:hypothetical protein